MWTLKRLCISNLFCYYKSFIKNKLLFQPRWRDKVFCSETLKIKKDISNSSFQGNKRQWSQRTRKQVRGAPQLPYYSADRVSNYHAEEENSSRNRESLEMKIQLLGGQKNKKVWVHKAECHRRVIQRETLYLQASSEVCFWQISNIQTKITRHTRKQEKSIYSEEGKKINWLNQSRIDPNVRMNKADY